jgi:hypothetical protein
MKSAGIAEEVADRILTDHSIAVAELATPHASFTVCRHGIDRPVLPQVIQT